MPEIAMHPFNLPAAWQSTDYPTKDTFAIDLEPRHLEVLNTDVKRFKATGGGHKDINNDTFP